MHALKQSRAITILQFLFLKKSFCFSTVFWRRLKFSLAFFWVAFLLLVMIKGGTRTADFYYTSFITLKSPGWLLKSISQSEEEAHFC